MLTNYLRVSHMDPHVKGCSKDQIYLVPPTTVPVQTWPRDDPLGCPTFVPSAVVVDVLPLLQNKNRIEVFGLMNVVSPSSTSSIEKKIVTDRDKILARQHPVTRQHCQVAQLKYEDFCRLKCYIKKRRFPLGIFRWIEWQNVCYVHASFLFYVWVLIYDH